jgi:hypothetical protein
MMRTLLLLSLCAGGALMSAQAPQTTVQTDLRSHGWNADRGMLKSSWLPSTMDFADDGSLWVVFPSEASQPLQTRSGSSGYAGKVRRSAELQTDRLSGAVRNPRRWLRPSLRGRPSCVWGFHREPWRP